MNLRIRLCVPYKGMHLKGVLDRQKSHSTSLSNALVVTVRTATYFQLHNHDSSNRTPSHLMLQPAVFDML